MAYPDSNPLRDIVIRDAFTITDETGTHAEYCVQVALTGREWEVRRRYRQFLALDERLRTKYARIMERIVFPPKQVFSVSRSVIRSRCNELQRYLLNTASVSIPVQIGAQTSLVRMREVDDFLEVAQHLHCPVEPANPRFSRPAGSAAARRDDEFGGSSGSRARGSGGAARGSRREWMGQQLLPVHGGKPRARSRPGESAAAGPSVSDLAATAARHALGQGRSAFEGATVAVVAHAVGRLLQPGCGTREEKTVARFLEEARTSPKQAPDAALASVREFVEDLAAWMAHHRAEDLSVVVQDARAAAVAAARSVGELSGGHGDSSVSLSVAATTGGARQRANGAAPTPPMPVLRLDESATDVDSERVAARAAADAASGAPPHRMPDSGSPDVVAASSSSPSGVEPLQLAPPQTPARLRRAGSGSFTDLRPTPTPGSGPESVGRRDRPYQLSQPMSARLLSKGAQLSDDEEGASSYCTGGAGPDDSPSTGGLTTPPASHASSRVGAANGGGGGGDAGGDLVEPWQLLDDDVDEDTRLLRRAARRAVEAAVVLPLASDLLYRAQQCAGAADAIFSARLAAVHGAMGGLRPDQFGVGPEVEPAARHSSVGEAAAHLLAMEQMPTPALMAERLLRSVRCVYTALASLRPSTPAGPAAGAGVASGHAAASPGQLPNPSAATGNDGVGADDFLPLFLWSVAISGMSRPATCEAFIKGLTPAVDLRGELAYYCTTLEGAVFYVSKLEVRSDVCASADGDDSPGALAASGTGKPGASGRRSPPPLSPRLAPRVPAEAALPARSTSSASGWGWFRSGGTPASSPGARAKAGSGASSSAPAADASASQPVALSAARPFRSVQLLDGELAAASVGSPRDNRMSMGAAAAAAAAGREPCLIPARALRHPAFRAINAVAAAHILADAAWEVVCERAAAASKAAEAAATGAPGAAPAAALTGTAARLTRRDMVSVGPTAGWMWVLHPVAPPLPVAVSTAAIAAVPGGVDAPTRASAACLLALSFTPLPPRPVAGCSASLREWTSMEALRGGGGGGGPGLQRSVSTDAANASAAVSAAAGGAWASLFAHEAEAAGSTSPRAASSGTASSEAAADAVWAHAASAASRAQLPDFVRRVFIVRQSDDKWFFLPPQGKTVEAHEGGAVASSAWPPLSKQVPAWRWSGPFPSLQACVVWCQTTYEGVGSADLKRLAAGAPGQASMLPRS